MTTYYIPKITFQSICTLCYLLATLLNF